MELALLALLVGLSGSSENIAPPPPRATVYRNAQVWTGEGFARKALAVREGRFIPKRQAGRDAAIVDLKGGYVVPAYANAHVHITPASPQISWSFIKDGVFYAWNPNTVVMGEATLAFYARTDTYDVAVAQGGITEPSGHPEKIYVVDLATSVYKGMKLSDFLGNAFSYGRTRKEIDASLDRLVSQKAAFVKSYLLYSEEYEERRDDPKFYGKKGLNPTNVPYLVSAARQRGLPVAFHVETAADLRTAAEGGAHMAAHLPAYETINSPEDLVHASLSREDARAVAASGMLLVPTYGLAPAHYQQQEKERKVDAALKRIHYAVQAENIRVLKEAGARFLTGTDSDFSIFRETEHLVAIGGLTNAEALQMVLGTARHLFPKRRIGCFDAGCEADFLVLAADPSKDIVNLRKIRRRVKGGQEMQPPPP